MTSAKESSRNLPVYHVFHVKDEYWTKIGAAWRTKSGNGLSVSLDLLPPDGRFVLMEPKAKSPAPPGGRSANTEW